MTATMTISDKLYRQADETARLLGVSNMQLFEIAIEQYIREHSMQNQKPRRKIGLLNGIGDVIFKDNWEMSEDEFLGVK